MKISLLLIFLMSTSMSAQTVNNISSGVGSVIQFCDPMHNCIGSENAGAVCDISIYHHCGTQDCSKTWCKPTVKKTSHKNFPQTYERTRIMKKIAMTVVFLAAISLHAQTAKVIALEPADAQKAAKLADELKKAQTAMKDFQIHVQDKYVSKPCTTIAFAGSEGKLQCSIGGGCTCRTDGWEHSFEFSEDYKFIVPKQSPPSYQPQNTPSAPWLAPHCTCPLGDTICYC
jgi:hypothetical protein